MPRQYSRRTRSRRGRRTRRTTPWYNRKYNAMQLAAKAAKGVWYLKGLVNSEMFHYDRAETAVAISSAGAMTNLVQIGSGDQSNQRTGNSVLLRNHLFRLRVTKNASASTTIFRYMIVQDTQQISDTSPTVGDVLDTVDVDSPLNLANSGRFKILVNKTIMLHANSPMYHKESYKSMYLHIKFNGTAPTDIQKNGLYLLTISDQPTNTPVIDLWSRLGYRDN